MTLDLHSPKSEARDLKNRETLNAHPATDVIDVIQQLSESEVGDFYSDVGRLGTMDAIGWFHETRSYDDSGTGGSGEELDSY